MPKVLDLNNIKVPVLEIVFADKAHTALHVNAPTEALVNEMENWVKDGLETLAAGDKSSIEAAYDMTARLLSCNREGIELTSADLRGKYAVDIWTLIPILNAYVEFISEIKNEKN